MYPIEAIRDEGVSLGFREFVDDRSPDIGVFITKFIERWKAASILKKIPGNQTVVVVITYLVQQFILQLRRIIRVGIRIQKTLNRSPQTAVGPPASVCDNINIQRQHAIPSGVLSFGIACAGIGVKPRGDNTRIGIKEEEFPGIFRGWSDKEWFAVMIQVETIALYPVTSTTYP